MRQAWLLRLGGCMQQHKRKNNGDEEGDSCRRQADMHIYDGRYLYEHLQKKLPFSPPSSQPASLLCFCDKDNHLILEPEAVDELA
ncbi:unnamed protein product [Sphagnum jensenii]|uniref:Uncharacterized protein n=1 Tax=Sphagnum jensenii TaxID=128206 RepID=A0ABP0VTC3_9BRYO